MPRHPQEPHLFALSFDGNTPMAVVRAMSFAEARDFLLAEFIALERLTPERAFHLGQLLQGRAVLNAKPEYADFNPDPAQPDLLDDDRAYTDAERQQLAAQGAPPHTFNRIHASAETEALGSAVTVVLPGYDADTNEA